MASYLVSQGYALVNDAFAEVTGADNIDVLDTTDVVSMGKQLTDFDLVDKFYGAIANRIARTVCCALNYNAKTRNILKDSVSWGGFIQKIYTVSPDAVETKAYNVENGTADATPYGINDGIEVFVKVFGGSTTWSLEFKTPTVQLRKCFLGDSEMMAFIDSQFIQAQSTAELQKESLVDLAVSTGVAYAYVNGNAINVLDMYNEQFGKSLNSENCEYDADYIKFANMIINKETRLLSRPSINNTPDRYLNYSNRDNLSLEVQSDFAERSKVYLESGTYHDDKVSISGNYDDIDFWQSNVEGERKSVFICNNDLSSHDEDETINVQLGNVIAVARDNDYVACHFDNNYSWSLPNPRARTHYYGFDFERGYAVDGCQCAKVFIESSHLPFDDTCTVKSTGYSGTTKKYYWEITPVIPTGKTLNKVYYSIDGGSTWEEISAVGGEYIYSNYVKNGDDIYYSDWDVVFKATFNS